MLTGTSTTLSTVNSATFSNFYWSISSQNFIQDPVCHIYLPPVHEVYLTQVSKEDHLPPTLQPDTRSSRQVHKVTSCIPPPPSFPVTPSLPHTPSPPSQLKKRADTKRAAVSQLSAGWVIYERKCLVVHLWLELSVRAKTNRCSAGSVQPPQRHIQTHEEGWRGGLTAQSQSGVILK